MVERLPRPYRVSLNLKRSAFKRGELHSAVADLVLAFDGNFKMRLPKLNYPLMLYQYLRDLALPIEVYPTSARLCILIDRDLSFPTKDSPADLIANPDVLLVALLIVATKILYPFDHVHRAPWAETDPTRLRMDWGKWNAEFSQHQQPKESVSKKNVWDMGAEEMDNLVALLSQPLPKEESGASQGRDSLLRLFPVLDRKGKEPDLLPPQHDSTEEEINARIISVQNAMTLVPPESESSGHRPGSLYPRYESEDQLPEIAKTFHRKCAEISGLRLTRLLRAVILVENLLERQKRSGR